MIIQIDNEKGLELLCVSHEFQKNVNKEARRENLIQIRKLQKYWGLVLLWLIS